MAGKSSKTKKETKTEHEGLFYPASDEYLKDVDKLFIEGFAEDSRPEVTSLIFQNGRVVSGLLVGETEDSLIVINPCVLVSDAKGRTVSGENITKAPIVRLLKAGILMVTKPDSLHEYYFLKHLTTCFDRYPAFFDDSVRSGIANRVVAWEEAGFDTSLEGLIEADPEEAGKSIAKQIAAQLGSSKSEEDSDWEYNQVVPYKSSLKH